MKICESAVIFRFGSVSCFDRRNGKKKERRKKRYHIQNALLSLIFTRRWKLEHRVSINNQQRKLVISFFENGLLRDTREQIRVNALANAFPNAKTYSLSEAATGDTYKFVFFFAEQAI